MKNIKHKPAVIGSIVFTILCFIGFSWAYYDAIVVGEGKNMVVIADGLTIHFTDGTDISTTEVKPGWSTSKTFTVKNKSEENYKYNLLIEDFTNTLVLDNGLQYKITCDNNDGYNMADFIDVPKSATPQDLILARLIEIPIGQTHTYTIEFRYLDSDEDQSEDMGKTFSGTLGISVGRTETLYERILANNPTRLTRDSFDEIYADVNTETLYMQSGNFTEDGSTVYYFAGDPQNNWVKFGKAHETTCTFNNMPIMYANMTNQVMKETNITESECTETYLCEAYMELIDGSDSQTFHISGLQESECVPETFGLTEEVQQQEGMTATFTYITEKATFSSLDKDIYWRIIRTNEDKSVRLLYMGLAPNTTNASIGQTAFNGTEEDYLHDSYVGYMYGTDGSLAEHRTNTNDSTIKTFIDSWYSETINTFTDGTNKYHDYVSKTAIYCNDRSIEQWYGANSNYNSTDFGPNRRLYSYINTSNPSYSTYSKPSYKCGVDKTGTLYTTAGDEDKFSVSTSSGGNGDLTYPIALMTADEIVYAGGAPGYVSEAVDSPWFNKNSEGSASISSYWWTMSPAYISYDLTPYVYTVSYDRAYNSSYRTYYNWMPVRPVLSLKACATYSSGDGSSTSPYEVTIDELCAKAEN